MMKRMKSSIHELFVNIRIPKRASVPIIQTVQKMYLPVFPSPEKGFKNLTGYRILAVIECWTGETSLQIGTL